MAPDGVPDQFVARAVMDSQITIHRADDRARDPGLVHQPKQGIVRQAQMCAVAQIRMRVDDGHGRTIAHPPDVKQDWFARPDTFFL